MAEEAPKNAAGFALDGADEQEPDHAGELARGKRWTPGGALPEVGDFFRVRSNGTPWKWRTYHVRGIVDGHRVVRWWSRLKQYWVYECAGEVEFKYGVLGFDWEKEWRERPW